MPLQSTREYEIPVPEHSNEERKDDAPVPTPQDFLSLPLPVAQEGSSVSGGQALGGFNIVSDREATGRFVPPAT